MRANVLSLALVAAIITLPVPASQLLAGTFSAPTHRAGDVADSAGLAVLLQDPFLIDQLSITPVRTVLDTEPTDEMSLD